MIDSVKKFVCSKPGMIAALGAVGSASAFAEDAVKMAISSPLLETTIDGARGILINITGGPDLSLFEANSAASLVSDAVDPNANIIFGATVADGFQDEMRVTVIATGFDEKKASAPRVGAFSANVEKSRPVEDDSDIDAIFKIFNR